MPREKFNPIRFEEVTRGGNFDFEASVNRERFSQALGGAAGGSVIRVFGAHLVGQGPRFAPFLVRAHEWLTEAVDQRLPWGEVNEFSWELQSEALGFAQWLLHGGGDAPRFVEAMRFSKEHRRKAESDPKAFNLRFAMDSYMRYAVQTDDIAQMEQAIGVYETDFGAGTPDIRKAKSERVIGYAVCLGLARGVFARDKLRQAVSRLLVANCEDYWINPAPLFQAITWLKILYWHLYEGDLATRPTPHEVILKAYDHMPNVVRPVFAV